LWGAAPSAADVPVEDIRPMLNQLAAALRLALAAPGSELASLVPVLQNLTDAMKAFYLRIKSCRVAA